jgi:sugar phosphate isomerase/epimerase
MSGPRLSIRLEMLPGDGVAAQIANAARFGFDAVALPGRFKDSWLSGLLECIADVALPVAGMSLGFRHSLLSPDPVRRAECRDSLVELLDLCAGLGAPLLNVPPCLIQDNAERLTDPETCDALLLEQLPALGDAAQERNVRFLLEPVNKYESDYLNSIEAAAALTRRIGHSHIGCTADFFHMQMEELSTEKALQAAGGEVRHVHVAENTRVEPGPGSMRFQPGFRVLKEAGYAGWIEVECRRLSGEAETVLPRCVDYLRQQWHEA